jgi:hypothetical protein
LLLIRIESKSLVKIKTLFDIVVEIAVTLSSLIAAGVATIVLNDL